MAMEYRKTTSLVRLNAKIESVNQLQLDFSGADIEEGRFIVANASGKAIRATAGALGTGSHSVLLSFLDTTHGSVKDKMQNVFDESAPVIYQSSGGLTGLVGSGLLIGIHKKHWDIVGSPAIGDAVIVGASAKPRNTVLSGGGALAGNIPFFGTILKIVDDIIFFTFETVGRTTGVGV
jgi:hypothetical protein